MINNYYFIKNIKKYISKKDITLKQLVRRLNNSSPLLFQIIVDKKNKFIGTITDGDLRKYILNHDLDSYASIKKMVNKKSNIGFINKDKDNLAKLIKFSNKSKKKTDFLPILDSKGYLKKILILDNRNTLENFACFIFAGGQGKRLRPLSKKIPKPLIKINKKSLIQMIINKVNDTKINNFYISLNYKKNLIIKELNSKKFSNIQFSFLQERKKLGTAGSLSMLHNFSFENLLIMNSDVLTKLDLTKFINYYLEFEFDVLIGAATLNYNIPYGVIKDTQGKLIDIDEKPDQTFKVVSGIYLMKSSLTKHVKKNKYLDMPDFIKLLLRKKYNVGVFPIYEQWIDVGTHESLIRGKEIF